MRMRKILIVMSISSLIISSFLVAVSADEAVTNEDLLEKIEKLEAENEALKEEIKALQGEKSEVDIDGNEDILHITQETEFPIIVYDGELGMYQINSLNYYSDPSYSPVYETGYVFELEFSNMYDKAVNASLGHCYLNDYKCPVYYDITEVAPGKKAVTKCYMRDEDITDSMKDYSVIECDYIVFEEGDYLAQSTGSTDIYSRPLLIDRNAISVQ